MPKHIGETSLTKVFELIEEKVNTLKNLIDGKAEENHSHSYNDLTDKPSSTPSIGGSDCTSVMISGVVDLSTMRVVSMSHTYAEIKAILEAKKMVFVETYYGFGYAYGQITSDNLQYNSLFFQVMLQNDFGDGMKLYYLTVRVSSSDNITLTPYIINTTAMGG